jgi:predicted dehydrogenase
MDEIRWGMIGTGDVTERKSGPAFNRVEHSSLVAVMNRTPAKAADYACRHGVPRWYATAEELIADPEINIVYIATPPDSHAEYTSKVAEAGKAVYVEKPMARTSAECQQMVETCLRAGVPLFAAYYRRCLPSFVKVRELVHSGAVGDVRLINVRLFHPPHAGDGDPANLPWRVKPEIAGGGYFYDLGSHQMDYLDYLFGPVTTTAAIAGNQAGLYSAEDVVTAAWNHESGVMGSGAWCFTAAPGQQVDLAEIVGSRGRITFSFFEQIPVRLENADGAQEWSFPRQDPIQQPLVQTIVDELRGVGKSPSTGESAARTNRVLEEMLRFL